MNPSARSAEEGLFSWAERWSPTDAQLWRRWRSTLTAEQRADVLLPLQAILSGLVAFRHLENHPLSATVNDFRPHLHAMHVGYEWALDLLGRLGSGAVSQQRLRSVSAVRGEPEASLDELHRSLTDALRVTQRLLKLPLVDAGAFQASCDLFLRDLERNAFFQPPEPLEFSNVAELVRPESLAPELEAWKSDAAKMTTLIAFLTLLRGHRFLGIADRQFYEDDGLYRAHIVIAAVRRELRTLTRFMLVQGVETLAEEFEARLLSLDAHHITGARTEIAKASKELKELRESVEALAMSIHSKARTALDGALPELDTDRSTAREAERLRNAIREVRRMLKDAAKELRNITRPARIERKSERVQRNLHQDIWAFRFILRAFVAKASVASVGADYWSDLGSLDFVGEFVRHFRVFGPRLARETDYSRGGPLGRAIGVLEGADGIDAAKLDLVVRECVLFLEHLDDALAELTDDPELRDLPFDKKKAATELRGYLRAARDRTASDRAAAGAFGLIDHKHAEAS